MIFSLYIGNYETLHPEKTTLYVLTKPARVANSNCLISNFARWNESELVGRFWHLRADIMETQSHGHVSAYGNTSEDQRG